MLSDYNLYRSQCLINAVFWGELHSLKNISNFAVSQRVPFLVKNCNFSFIRLRWMRKSFSFLTVNVCDILSLELSTFRNYLAVTGSRSSRWQTTFTTAIWGNQYCRVQPKHLTPPFNCVRLVPINNLAKNRDSAIFYSTQCFKDCHFLEMQQTYIAIRLEFLIIPCFFNADTFTNSFHLSTTCT